MTSFFQKPWAIIFPVITTRGPLFLNGPELVSSSHTRSFGLLFWFFSWAGKGPVCFCSEWLFGAPTSLLEGIHTIFFSLQSDLFLGNSFSFTFDIYRGLSGSGRSHLSFFLLFTRAQPAPSPRPELTSRILWVRTCLRDIKAVSPPPPRGYDPLPLRFGRFFFFPFRPFF